LECPEDVTIDAHDNDDGFTEYVQPTITVTDDYSQMDDMEEATKILPMGITTMNVVATDSAGNEALCSYKVTVQGYNYSNGFTPGARHCYNKYNLVEGNLLARDTPREISSHYSPIKAWFCVQDSTITDGFMLQLRQLTPSEMDISGTFFWPGTDAVMKQISTTDEKLASSVTVPVGCDCEVPLEPSEMMFEYSNLWSSQEPAKECVRNYKLSAQGLVARTSPIDPDFEHLKINEPLWLCQG
jgi:hypothetical protein